MFFTQPTYGFTSGYPKSYVFDGNMLCSSYVQSYLGVYPSILGGWYTSAPNSEVSPWAWQWNERVGIQGDHFNHRSCVASITQPQVQPIHGVDKAPPVFSRVVGGPVSNTKRPEIVCPRPIYPLPKWVAMTGWEDDEGEGESEEEEKSSLTPGPIDTENDTDWKEEEWSDEDYDEDLDVARRSLPPFILSPDPEDLPTPFFHLSRDSTPSPHTLASISPDACDLPQPHFDPDPYSPISDASSQSNVPGLACTRSSRTDSFESIVSPDPGDLPPPDFEICDRFEVGELEFPAPLDCHQNQLGERGARDHARWGSGKNLWKVVTGGGRKVSGSGRHRRWPIWAWGR